MSNTYTQFHHQYVFAPKYRAAVIQPEWEVELYKYITGIVQNNKHKMLCINGMPDHLHLLIGFHTTQSIADFMQDVKSGSSKWINDKKLTKSRFEWHSTLKTNLTKIKVADLAHGIYHLKITSGKNIYLQTVVIQ